MKRRNDGLHKIGTGQLIHRDIYRNPSGLGPVHSILACTTQNEVADADDQPGILGYRNELGRRDIAEFGIDPPK